VVQKYLSKISGPLLDRIDIHIEVTPVSFEELSSSKRNNEKSTIVRQRVINARAIQLERYQKREGIYCNAQMPGNQIKVLCAITDAGNNLLKTAMQRLNLSARAYDRILKVARTIADLDNSVDIQTHHLAEAIHYRSLDRENWSG
jgi:magnesium chelatase family protein